MDYNFADNLQKFLRLANIFGPQAEIGNDLPSQGGITGTMTPDNSAMTNDYDVNARLQQLYQPESDISDRYRDVLLGDMPTREQPSRTRRILAGIATMGHPERTEEVLYRPYYRKMADWEKRADVLGKGASTERLGNVNQRILAEQTIGREQSQQKIENTERVSEAKLKIAQQRANAYDFKSRNPDWKSFIDDKGMLVFVNPKDPSMVARTEVDTGKMSDMDKINLQIEGRLKVAAATGSEARKTEVLRSSGDIKEIQERGKQQRETKRVPSASGRTIGPELPTQSRVRIANRAQKAKAEHPEWSKFITIDGNNVAVQTPTTGGYFSRGPTADMHKAITDYIYNAPEDKAPAAPVGWKYVRKAGGGWTAVEDKK